MKGKSKIQLALWTLLFMVAIPISAYGVDGQIKIAQTAETTFPIQINEPGSYVLTSNLIVAAGNAININVSNVTLDLNGHTIHGFFGGATGTGIYAYNRYNITIKNGIVRGFRDYGIYLDNDADHRGAGHRIEGIQAFNNGYGICIYAGYSIVTNCTANKNGYDGILTYFSTVTNCTANNNGNSGIIAPSSTVTNCTANDNGYKGIYVVDGTVTNCTANNNDSNGIYACTSIVKGCNVRYNTGYGINMGSGAHNYIYRNAASGNTAGQILCPSGNTCVDNATF